jgi:cation transport ATPase
MVGLRAEAPAALFGTSLLNCRAAQKHLNSWANEVKLGFMPPWLAGIGMAGSSLWVIANALRLAKPLKV